MKKILKEALGEISPTEAELKKINNKTKEIVSFLEKRIKKLKVKADVFVGGSFPKNTLIKKENYDVDVFVRFDKSYSEEKIKKSMKKVLRRVKKKRIHGSRDYYQMRADKKLYFEIVPTKKVTQPKFAENITDLSYFHVNYIKKKIKNKKIYDEIKLAKAFCQGAGVYGAESHINGFSGYSLELLIIHFKTFEKMLKELAKVKEKLIIDTEKFYKKKNILLEVNESKLDSPIILIDPTYKERNALAALNVETFEKFQGVAKEFLKNPSIDFFRKKEVSLKTIKIDATNKGHEFILVKSRTKKPEGVVAATKLFKFNNHLKEELKNCFTVHDYGFNYLGKKDAESYFVLEKKKSIIITGPKTNDTKHADKFRSEHADVKTKAGRLYAHERVTMSGREFLKAWLKKNKRKVKEMYIKRVGVY